MKSREGFWAKRKNKKKDNQKVDQDFVKDFIGDERIYQRRITAWESMPQIGMDKIRAKSDAAKYFVDFASTSSIHGLNHLTAPHRHPIEKFLAVLFIGGALAILIYLSLEFWNRYQYSATITILNNNYKSLQVTRPAMLLCPVFKYNATIFSEVFKKYEIDDTVRTRNFFTFLSEASILDYEVIDQIEPAPPEKWLSILWDLKGTVVTDEVNSNFKTWIVTEQGFCLSYYSPIAVYSSHEYWSQNNWSVVPVPDELPYYTYPEREQLNAINIVTHSFEVNSFYPLEIPNFYTDRILIEKYHLVTIKTIPREIQSSMQVKELAVHQRHCKKIDDGGLKLWPVYTEGMCVQECVSDLMRKYCGCYPHFVRPMHGVPICTSAQLKCISNHADEYSIITLSAGKRCHCVPNCDTATYIDVLLSESILPGGVQADAVLKSQIDWPPEIIRREILFAFSDVLTSIGGAAGLLLGASVISFVEIFYFITLRLFWYRIDTRKKRIQHEIRMENIREKTRQAIKKY